MCRKDVGYDESVCVCEIVGQALFRRLVEVSSVSAGQCDSLFEGMYAELSSVSGKGRGGTGCLAGKVCGVGRGVLFGNAVSEVVGLLRKECTK